MDPLDKSLYKYHHTRKAFRKYGGIFWALINLQPSLIDLYNE